jgi:hypothetical protein
MLRINATVDKALEQVKFGTRDLEDVLEVHFDDLYDHYTNNGEMPYGVSKARDGDPMNWIINRLEQELGL